MGSLPEADLETIIGAKGIYQHQWDFSLDRRQESFYLPVDIYFRCPLSQGDRATGWIRIT